MARGLPVDGVKAEGHSNGPTILFSRIFDTRFWLQSADRGISTKCLSWNWTIRNNVIEEQVPGIYLGDSNGENPLLPV